MTNNLGLLSLFTGCSVDQDVERGYMGISQTAFIETLAKRFDVSSTSEYPAVVGANLEARMEGESGGAVGIPGGCRVSDVASDDDTAGYRKCSPCCGSPLSQPYRAALEGRPEDNRVSSRQQVSRFDF